MTITEEQQQALVSCAVNFLDWARVSKPKEYKRQIESMQKAVATLEQDRFNLPALYSICLNLDLPKMVHANDHTWLQTRNLAFINVISAITKGKLAKLHLLNGQLYINGLEFKV